MQKGSSSHLVPFQRFSLLAYGRVSNLEGPVLLGLIGKLLSCSPEQALLQWKQGSVLTHLATTPYRYIRSSQERA